MRALPNCGCSDGATAKFAKRTQFFHLSSMTWFLDTSDIIAFLKTLTDGYKPEE
jgi:hypothetical protein